MPGAIKFCRLVVKPARFCANTIDLKRADHLGVLWDRDPDVLQEHEPPHFHAEYQGQQGKFSFDGEVVVGHIPSRTARRLIREWASLHRRELEVNWENMKAGRPLERIEPLQ